MLLASQYEIKENYPLKNHTSFRTGGLARYYFEASSYDSLVEVYSWAVSNRIPILIMGGATNMVVNDSGFSGLVLRPFLLGKTFSINNDGTIFLSVGSGEVWDDVVDYVVKQGLWGIENLSHIPGLTGSIPVQNVGAYGQEASRVIHSLDVFDRLTFERKQIMADQCGFGYRTSIFNTVQRNRYIILGVTFLLKSSGVPIIDYPDLKIFFKDKTPSLIELRKSIIEIRDKKLPLPSLMGNAGSFFKNILLDESSYNKMIGCVCKNFDQSACDRIEDLKNKFTRDSNIKIPTAFLIELCGLKGVCSGGACIHEGHSLVIVNKTGTATSYDIMSLFRVVRQRVFSLCGVILMNEPELIGFTDEELEEYFRLD